VSSPDARQRLVLDFRGAYGRMMMLACQAHGRGVSLDLIAEAARGEGDEARIPELPLIRRQWNIATGLLERAVRNGASRHACLAAAREAKRAAEGEWGMEIPIASRGA